MKEQFLETKHFQKELKNETTPDQRITMRYNQVNYQRRVY